MFGVLVELHHGEWQLLGNHDQSRNVNNGVGCGLAAMRPIPVVPARQGISKEQTFASTW